MQRDETSSRNPKDTMNALFDQFVQRRIKNCEFTVSPVDTAKELELWLTKLDQFYAVIARTLRPWTERGSVQLILEEFTLDEFPVGPYQARRGRIIIGDEMLRLDPIGTFLIGSRGRVDMRNGFSTSRFVIVPPGASTSRFNPHVDPANPDAGVIFDDPPIEEWVWKLMTPSPRIHYIDLTPMLFREQLMGLIDDE